MKMFPNLSVNTGFKIAHLDKPIIVLTDDVKEIKEVLRDSNLNVDQWSIILPLSMYNEALNNTYKRNIYWANDYNVNAIVNQIIKEWFYVLAA